MSTSTPKVRRPAPPDESMSTRLIAASTAIMLVVFLGDVIVPLGIAGGVLYVIVVLLALQLPSRSVYGIAAICTVLTAVGFFVSAQGGDLLIDLANRGVAMLAIWVVAILGLHRRRLFEIVRRHSQIIDQVEDGVITARVDGVIDYWNKGAESIFGYPANAMIGRSVERLYLSGEPEAVGDDVMARLLTEGSTENETHAVKGNGEVILIRQWLLLRRNARNEPAGVIFQVSDITRRREQEKVANRMEAFYQNVLDELPLQVAIFDTEGRFLYLNPASLSSPEKRAWIVGRTEREYFESVGRNLEVVETRHLHRTKAMKSRERVTFEEDFITRSGDRRTFLNGFVPVVGKDGEIVKVLGYRYDITDHKQMTWDLQESLARLRAIVDTAGDGIITIDGNGLIESCNQAAQRLFRLAPTEAIGMRVERLFQGNEADDRAAFHDGYLTSMISTGRPEIGEFLAMRSDGTSFPVEVATSKLNLNERPLFTAIIRDLSVRKEAERALVRYNERLAAFRQMDQAILTASSTRAVAQVAADHLIRMVPAGTVSVALFDAMEGNVSSVLTIHCDGRQTRKASVGMGEFLGIESQSECEEVIARASSNGFVRMATVDGNGGDDQASAIAIPLIIQESAIGMLKLEAKDGAHFEEEDIDIAREVSGVLAIAIHDAHLFEEVDASRKRLRALSHRLVDVQEQERRLIARELHDEIGQALTGLKFSLETLEARANLSSDGQIEEARHVTLQLLARVRDLSLDLRPAMLDDLGLLPALLWLTDRYSRQTGVEVSFRHSGLDQRLGSEIETAAYRIVQEALTNVARHAGPANVEVLLLVSGDTLIVRIKDDGAGFDFNEAMDRKNSTGLSGMNERTSLLGGTFVVETDPGQGTMISAEFPLATPENLEIPT